MLPGIFRRTVNLASMLDTNPSPVAAPVQTCRIPHRDCQAKGKLQYQPAFTIVLLPWSSRCCNTFPLSVHPSPSSQLKGVLCKNAAVLPDRWLYEHALGKAIGPLDAFGIPRIPRHTWKLLTTSARGPQVQGFGFR